MFRKIIKTHKRGLGIMETLNINGLSEINIKRVQIFIEDLKAEEKRKKLPKKFSFNWRGGLAHLKDKYTSVELQHKCLDWW